MAGEKIAIDFGSAQTKIYKLGYGMVLSEPTLAAVAVDEKSSVRAVGKEAKKLVGKTAEKTKVIYPVIDGEVVAGKIAVSVLTDFLKKIEFKNGFGGGKALVAVPCGVDGNFLKRYESVLADAGISSVDFAYTPILSVIGQDLTLTEFSPYFVIDMGAGITDIAAVSLEGVIAGVSVNAGLGKVDTALIDFIAEEYGLQIGILTAEKLKIQIGSLIEKDTLSAVVNGRDLSTGKPRSISLSSKNIRPVLCSFYDTVADIALKVLAKLPPEVSAEIRHSGIYLSGGGAKIYGLEEYFLKKFGMPINVAQNPDMCVAFGGGVALGNNEMLKKIVIKTD